MDDDSDNPVPNPFLNLPMFGEMAKALAGQGPLNWDAARQFAQLAATSGGTEANVDPTVRMAIQSLASIVDMHVRDLTGFEGSFPEFATVTPGVWAQQTLAAYRPLFTEMAVSLGRRDDAPAANTGTDDDGLGSMMAMFQGLSQMMAPSMMGMAIGSMVGRMATRAFGQYDLPIPRSSEASTGRQQSLLVPATVDAFAADWSIPADEMRLWVIAQEYVGHVLFATGTVRDDVTALVRRHVGAFQPDASAIADHLGGLVGDNPSAMGDPMQAMQRAFSDPALLLGAVQSPEQAALAPRLDAAIAAVVGYVDYLVDSVAVRLIGGEALRIAEAARRRRATTGPDDTFIERLLGVSLSPAQVQRGKSFAAGVCDRSGERGLTQAFAAPNAVPTPAEVDAPGLWLARLGLDG